MATAIDTVKFTVQLPGDESRKLHCRILSSRKYDEFEDLVDEINKHKWSKLRTAAIISALTIPVEKVEVDGEVIEVSTLSEHFTRIEIDKLYDLVAEKLVITEVDLKKLQWQSPSEKVTAA